jgi:Sel1 repeat
MTEIVDPEILAQAAESMRLNYGDVSDLPLELVNTLANVHYRFHELARARMPSTPDAFEAWSKRAARYGPAAKHAPDMVKQARAVRSNPEDFRFIVGTMIDTMKYRIDPEFALNLPEAERARRRDPSKVDEIPDLSARMGLTKRPAPPDAVAAYGKGDYTTVLRLIRPLADQGQADAQFNLGLMYYRGEGIPQNYVEAMRWCRLAADQGHAFAQSHLGTMYYKGHGVPQNFAEAAKWYRRADDQGDAFGQHNLGVMYHNGEGLPQDYAEAAKWYRRAADQGHADAQFNLGIMFYKGEGVPQTTLRR